MFSMQRLRCTSSSAAPEASASFSCAAHASSTHDMARPSARSASSAAAPVISASPFLGTLSATSSTEEQRCSFSARPNAWRAPPLRHSAAHNSASAPSRAATAAATPLSAAPPPAAGLSSGRNKVPRKTVAGCVCAIAPSSPSKSNLSTASLPPVVLPSTSACRLAAM